MSATEFFIISASITFGYAYFVHRLIYGADRGNDASPTAALERAERRMAVAKNVVATTFLISAILKFTIYNGWVAKSVTGLMALVVGIPFLISIAVYFKARRDVKRANARAEGPKS